MLCGGLYSFHLTSVTVFRYLCFYKIDMTHSAEIFHVFFYKTPPYDTCSFPRSPFLDTAKPDGKVAEVWRADSGGEDDSNDH